MKNLTKLINIAKRIHNTEASRAEILQDLASISANELEELNKLQFTEENIIDAMNSGNDYATNSKLWGKTYDVFQTDFIKSLKQ